MDAFSSVQDRPRDKILQERHQRELAEKDQKIERLRRANDESCKRHYDAQHRGNQLAQALGFFDIYEAQIAIDIVGHAMPYKEAFERVTMLQEELSVVRGRNEVLLERVGALEANKTNQQSKNKYDDKFVAVQAEKEALEQELIALRDEQTRHNAENKAAKVTISRLEQELSQLQGRYDALLDVKERAATRYKADYAKWRKVHDWIFDDADNAKYDGLSVEERKRQIRADLMQKKKMLMEISEGGELPPLPYPKPPPLGGISNKENQATPPRPKSAQSTHSNTHRIPSLRNKLLDSVSNSKPPSSSPNFFNEGSLSRSLPRTSDIQMHRNLEASSPTALNEPASSPPSSPTVVGTARKASRSQALDSVTPGEKTKAIASSPVEHKSSSLSSRQPLHFEPVMQPVNKLVKINVGSSSVTRQTVESSSTTNNDLADDSPRPFTQANIPTSPAPILSSETEADSQSQMFSLPFFDPTPCPTRPSKPSLTHVQSNSSLRAEPSNLPVKPAFPPRRRVVSNRDSDNMQPTKTRRLNDENEVETYTSKAATMTPWNDKGKGKVKDLEAPSSTPVNPPSTAGQKRIEDYSAYKGRGRYGKNADAPASTINAQFEIDPTRNGGLTYQYEEVVRGKNDRKQMEAGDCECCRDYYEAVGPLPKRLQAPLWRSPVSTPQKAKPCPRHSNLSTSASGSKHAQTSGLSNPDSSGGGGHKRRQAEITSHRQAISRHRHHWERPKTPPGYWNIGFPNTQETEEINEQAKEMHRRKRDGVEAAARKEHGRYRRRS